MGRLSFSLLLLAACAVASASASPAHSGKTHRHAAAKTSTQNKAAHPPQKAQHASARPGSHSPATAHARAEWQPKWRSAGHGSRSAHAYHPSEAPHLRAATLQRTGISHPSAIEPQLADAAVAERSKPASPPPSEPAAAEPATSEPSVVEQSAPGPAESEADKSDADASEAVTPETPAPSPAKAERRLSETAVPDHRAPKTAPAERTELAVRADAPAPIAPAEPTPASLRIPRGYVAPLRGSHESLVRQNEKTEAEGLERIQDSTDLNDRIARRLLVPVPASSALTVNPNLPQQFRYCRPWTARFLADIARAHETVFHRPVIVSSAVRTVEYQKHLELINGNAAPAEGDIVSPHLTGGTIDIAKSDLPRSELAWMRAYLAPLQAAGKLDVEEEFLQACFHITVYESYVPPTAPGKAKPRARRRKPALANALAAQVM
jgi:hypothetical protein